MTKVEKENGIDRNDIASRMLFMSHETYTPARGGSASAEVFALREVFQSAADQIVVANTKGATGHPMGVGIEDAVAATSEEAVAARAAALAPIYESTGLDPEDAQAEATATAEAKLGENGRSAWEALCYVGDGVLVCRAGEQVLFIDVLAAWRIALAERLQREHGLGQALDIVLVLHILWGQPDHILERDLVGLALHIHHSHAGTLRGGVNDLVERQPAELEPLLAVGLGLALLQIGGQVGHGGLVGDRVG